MGKIFYLRTYISRNNKEEKLMINKISFAGLKGLGSPENKKNLKLLNQIYGKTFLDSAQTVFASIDNISQDKDVFFNTAIKEGFAKDCMHFSITDSNQKEIASSSFKMGSKPENYANTPGLLKALTVLQQSFERNFTTVEEDSGLADLIGRYS